MKFNYEILKLSHGLLELEDGTLVLSRRVMACRVDFNHNLKKKGQSIEL
jgi:hypothetical protein